MFKRFLDALRYEKCPTTEEEKAKKEVDQILDGLKKDLGTETINDIQRDLNQSRTIKAFIITGCAANERTIKCKEIKDQNPLLFFADARHYHKKNMINTPFFKKSEVVEESLLLLTDKRFRTPIDDALIRQWAKQQGNIIHIPNNLFRPR